MIERPATPQTPPPLVVELSRGGSQNSAMIDQNERELNADLDDDYEAEQSAGPQTPPNPPVSPQQVGSSSQNSETDEDERPESVSDGIVGPFKRLRKILGHTGTGISCRYRCKWEDGSVTMEKKRVVEKFATKYREFRLRNHRQRQAEFNVRRSE